MKLYTFNILVGSKEATFDFENGQIFTNELKTVRKGKKKIEELDKKSLKDRHIFYIISKEFDSFELEDTINNPGIMIVPKDKLTIEFKGTLDEFSKKYGK